MPSGYIIANVRVTNPEQYEEYKKWSTEAFKAHNAEICVRGGQTQVMEGDWQPERVVIAKFPSFEAAKAFYDSAEYLRARQAREGAAIMRLVAVEGVCRPLNTTLLIAPCAYPSSATSIFDSFLKP